MKNMTLSISNKVGYIKQLYELTWLESTGILVHSKIFVADPDKINTVLHGGLRLPAILNIKRFQCALLKSAIVWVEKWGGGKSPIFLMQESTTAPHLAWFQRNTSRCQQPLLARTFCEAASERQGRWRRSNHHGAPAAELTLKMLHIGRHQK
jgi:hypothetical protein